MSKTYKLPKVAELFEAGVHFGHQVRRWHPSMQPYIYSVKNGIHIIDLEQTEKCLETACDKLYEVAKKGGKVIFVGTKKQSRDVIELEAKRCGVNYVTDRWLGGTISNFTVIKKNVDKLVKMMKGREDGSFDKYTKKERLLIDRDIEKLVKRVGGLIGLNGSPAALFIVDPKREKTAVAEARTAGIPVIALVDTNSNVVNIHLPIPGNDDAIKSTAIIVKAATDALEAGYLAYAKDLEDAKTAKETVKEEPKKEAVKVAEVEKPVVKKSAPTKEKEAKKEEK